MAKVSQILKKVKFHYPHFAVELLLLLILVFAISANLKAQANSQNPQTPNRSLLFVFLKNHPSIHPNLVESLESVNMNIKLASRQELEKQILAASTKDSNNKKPLNESVILPTLSGSALLKPNPATSNESLAKRDIEVYQVRGGDTVARIANAYGISIDTIVWENNLSNASYIKPGQELKILPVSGVKHTVLTGETIGGIAKKYGVDSEDVMEYNEIEFEEHIFPGEEIIIPNGVKKTPPSPARQQYLAGLQKEDYKKIEVPLNYQGSTSLIWPLPAAYRLSQGFRSRHRAIDIPCRDCEVVAAANGIVELGGWQRGYGNTIVLNHGGGLKTRYAHGSKLLVSAGQTVIAGQPIMISGSTGRSSGPHLHFEVKKDGVFLDPLKSVNR